MSSSFHKHKIVCYDFIVCYEKTWLIITWQLNGHIIFIKFFIFYLYNVSYAQNIKVIGNDFIIWDSIDKVWQKKFTLVDKVWNHIKNACT